MKKMCLAVSLSCLFFIAAAQEKKDHTPKWVSNTGYWVVESNTKTPDISTVYFYNNNDVLVYKEHLEGVRLSLNKRKIKMRLKTVLEQAVYTYEQKKFIPENENWLLLAIKK